MNMKAIIILVVSVFAIVTLGVVLTLRKINSTVDETKQVVIEQVVETGETVREKINDVAEVTSSTIKNVGGVTSNTLKSDNVSRALDGVADNITSATEYLKSEDAKDKAKELGNKFGTFLSKKAEGNK